MIILFSMKFNVSLASKLNELSSNTFVEKTMYLSMQYLLIGFVRYKLNVMKRSEYVMKLLIDDKIKKTEHLKVKPVTY